MAIVAVTALACAGQFTLFSYFAPYYKQRARHAHRRESSLLFIWFGVFGVLGNVVAARYVDRIGAAPRDRVAVRPDRGLARALAARWATTASAWSSDRTLGAGLLRVELGCSRRGWAPRRRRWRRR